MPILTIIGVLIVVGVVLWLINSYIPMQSSIKRILNGVVVILVVIWLLKVFGLLENLQKLSVQRYYRLLLLFVLSINLQQQGQLLGNICPCCCHFIFELLHCNLIFHPILLFFSHLLCQKKYPILLCHCSCLIQVCISR